MQNLKKKMLRPQNYFCFTKFGWILILAKYELEDHVQACGHDTIIPSNPANDEATFFINQGQNLFSQLCLYNPLKDIYKLLLEKFKWRANFLQIFMSFQVGLSAKLLQSF